MPPSQLALLAPPRPSGGTTSCVVPALRRAATSRHAVLVARSAAAVGRATDATVAAVRCAGAAVGAIGVACSAAAVGGATARIIAALRRASRAAVAVLVAGPAAAVGGATGGIVAAYPRAAGIGLFFDMAAVVREAGDLERRQTAGPAAGNGHRRDVMRGSVGFDGHDANARGIEPIEGHRDGDGRRHAANAPYRLARSR